MLGHCSSDRLEKTANFHYLKLNGEFKNYEECAIAHSRHENVNKDWKGGSKVLGDQLYLDIISIKN
jgi:hypothetical protein